LGSEPTKRECEVRTPTHKPQFKGEQAQRGKSTIPVTIVNPRLDIGKAIGGGKTRGSGEGKESHAASTEQEINRMTRSLSHEKAQEKRSSKQSPDGDSIKSPITEKSGVKKRPRGKKRDQEITQKGKNVEVRMLGFKGRPEQI